MMHGAWSRVEMPDRPFLGRGARLPVRAVNGRDIDTLHVHCYVSPMPIEYSLAELAALADVSVRTIRFYLAQGLLPAPGREGPQTRYPESTLHRLRLIRQLQRGHLPLAEIRNRIAGLSDADVVAILAEPVELPSNSALEYVRGVLAGSPRPESGAMDAPQARAALLHGSLLRRIEARPLTRPPALASPALAAPEVASAPAPEPAAAPAPGPAAATPPPTAPSPDRPQPERSQWERIELEPDIELHVRRPLSRIANKRVERLIAFARQLQKEDER